MPGQLDLGGPVGMGNVGGVVSVEGLEGPSCRLGAPFEVPVIRVRV